MSTDPLERRLYDAAETYFPATPELARTARARLGEQKPARRAPRLALGIALVAVAVVAGVLALSPGARSALRDLLDRVPGISIERAPTLPERAYRSTPSYGAPLDDLDDARRLHGRPLRMPAHLGEPDRLYWLAFPPGDMITAVYGDERRARLVFSQWKVGTTDLWHKVLASGTGAALVTVDGAPGIWIFGADHGVFYLAPGRSDGGPSTHHRAEAYLAGNVLAWQRNGIAYRLEAGVPLQEAMRIARSLEVVE